MTGRAALFLCMAALVGVARGARADGGTGSTGSTAGTGHSIRVDVRGAVALVTVTRALPAPRDGAAAETVLDIALPERSELLDVELYTGNHFERLPPRKPAEAREAYVESLRSLGLVAGEVPFDDDARYRIRVASRRDGRAARLQVRYSFSTILQARGDRCQLIFPAAPELSPVPAAVTVRAEPRGAITEIAIGGAIHAVTPGGPALAEATVSTRSRWSVSLVLALAAPTAAAAEPRPRRAEPIGAGSLPRPRLDVLLASVAAAPPLGSAVAYAVGGGGMAAVAATASAMPGGAPAAPRVAERRPMPERVLFLVDRSRSVGPAGLSAERDVARQILEALPPTTRFDALFFDRGTRRLFQMARPATREAITAFEDEMVPDRLANGTDLGGALRGAGDLLRREASLFGPQALLVVLTDGAVALPPGKTKLGDLVGPVPGVDLAVAVASVRADDDSRVGADEHRALRGLAAAAPLGGVEREIRASEIHDGVAALLEVLRGGGEIYAVGLTAHGASSPPTPVADVLAPDGGASGIVALAGKMVTPLRLSVTARGQERSVNAHAVTVAARWLAPHLARGGGGAAAAGSEMRLLAAPAATALIEPVLHPPPPPPQPGVQGHMERSVVRNALSMAFGPRARACYLGRSGATAAERDLVGRVRLALDLVRGEVAAARVESSTLARPLIEACLREAAFALEIPRAYRNDDPVTAVLNLVFRPRSGQERKAGVQDPAVAEEMDIMVDEALELLKRGEAPGDAALPPGFPAPPR